MKKLKKHSLSILVSIVFLLLALGSVIPIQVNTECGDPQHLVTEEIDPGESQLTKISIRVFDKQTDQPIPNIKVGIILRHYQCTPHRECLEECLMGLQIIDFADLITNDEGSVERLAVWYVSDLKDKLIGEVTVFDPTEVYYPVKTLIEVDRGDTFNSYSIRLFTDSYLLNDNL